MVLTWLDYVVIAGYLLAITAFGSWFARFQKTTRDYFLTGRSVPWWAICFTIVATETSTLSFIGVPAGAYAGNMTFLQLALGYIVGRFLVSVLFIPAYFRGELFTSYELLQRRFGPSVKNAAAIIFVVTRTLADGIRLFATALVISVVTQVPVPWTIVLLGAAMIVYTVRGGVAAVIWTDVVQMFVYVAGALVVFVALLWRIPGGWATVAAVGEAAGKFQVLDFNLDPLKVYTFWAGLFGGIALTLATHGTDQFLVQRLLSARSSRDAAKGLMLSGFIVFAQFLLFLFIGVMLYIYYQQTPLPRPLARNDEILPLFVVTGIPAGISGFIVAAIVDHRLGHRPDRRRAGRPMDRPVGARRRPARALVCRRPRAWGVPHRRTHQPRRIRRHAGRHGRGHGGRDRCMVDRRVRMDMVRARRRRNNGRGCTCAVARAAAAC